MSARYYDSCGAEGEIKPGKISVELREALNLPKNDVPIWIYRMRALGYPPGWLKKAVVDTSDIFDTDSSADNQTISKKRKQPSEDIQYDHSKLIEFPGFNSPMPKDCTDYHYFYNMPAMLEHQQLEYAKKHMNAFKPAQIPKRTKIETSVEDLSNPLDESNNVSSTTLDPTSADGTPASPDGEESKNTSTTETDRSAMNKSLVGIKLVSKGSPMPKPVARAPLEKFSEGVVGELLYFENLPSSTGKFDSIRGLLNNMRQSRGGETDASFESSKSEK